jgi:hypothetical protein
MIRPSSSVAMKGSADHPRLVIVSGAREVATRWSWQTETGRLAGAMVTYSAAGV